LIRRFFEAKALNLEDGNRYVCRNVGQLSTFVTAHHLKPKFDSELQPQEPLNRVVFLSSNPYAQVSGIKPSTLANSVPVNSS
jgi:hypothetical protein